MKTLGEAQHATPRPEATRGQVTEAIKHNIEAIAALQQRERAPQSRLEQYRSHLDLQVNLLTELKVTKLILLLEELRQNLPGRDRLNVEVEGLQEAADASELINALDDRGLTGEDTSTGPAKGATDAPPGK